MLGGTCCYAMNRKSDRSIHIKWNIFSMAVDRSATKSKDL